jgi:hypothetical protein
LSSKSLKTKIINLKINFIISFFNKKAMIKEIKEKQKAPVLASLGSSLGPVTNWTI